MHELQQTRQPADASAVQHQVAAGGRRKDRGDPRPGCRAVNQQPLWVTGLCFDAGREMTKVTGKGTPTCHGSCHPRS